MTLRRKLLAAALATGALFGYASGIAHLTGHCNSHRRERFEDHIADVCTRSAARVIAEERR
jgi:hypothetical protein